MQNSKMDIFVINPLRPLWETELILHFCGKRKPWKPSGPKRFAALYKHYMQLAARV